MLWSWVVLLAITSLAPFLVSFSHSVVLVSGSSGLVCTPKPNVRTYILLHTQW